MLPSFEIEIQLSEKAEKLIKRKKETIIVAACYGGIPKDTNLLTIHDFGKIEIRTVGIELKKGEQTAKFDSIRIPREDFELLADKNMEVLITGRKSSKYNLIHGDILQKRIYEIMNKKIILKQELIEEYIQKL